MVIRVLVTDETVTPVQDSLVEIEFPKIPVTVKTVARMAFRRARERDEKFLPQLRGIDVILGTQLVPDAAAETTQVHDHSKILIINRFVTPGQEKGAVYHQAD